MVLNSRNICSISFTSFNTLIVSIQHQRSFCKTKRKNVSCAFFFATSNSWIIASDPLGNAVRIFSYCIFSSSLPLAVLLPYYGIQGPGFYSDFFLRYVTFDTFKNHTLLTFPYLL